MAAGYLDRPQAVGLRRALFQVHLWVGLMLGLYVIVMSVTGSALVMRREIDEALCPRHVRVTPAGRPLSRAALTRDARAAYPPLRRARLIVHMPASASAPAEVTYLIGSFRLERLFNPYTGRNLGDTVACEPRFITGMVSLHDDLLAGDIGERINGVGALLLTMMCLTGAVLWWPGRARWRRSLTLRRGVHWRRFVWDLHSVLGFWLFLLLLMWAISAVYLAFPEPASWLMQRDLDHGNLQAFRAVNAATRALADLHFGRAYGTGIKVLWIVMGLVPAALFVTGATMWWNRVIRRAIGRSGEPTACEPRPEPPPDPPTEPVGSPARAARTSAGLP